MSKPAKLDRSKETRAERIERLLSGEKRLTTAARMFDERAYVEATAMARHLERYQNGRRQ